MRGDKLKFLILVSLGFAVAAAALHPKDFGPFVDNNQDAVSFLRSAFQVEQLVRSGVYFPRLSAYDFSGYGYPLFQFYPPLSFLIVGYVSCFLTHDVLSAMTVVVTLNFVVAGWLVYALCRVVGLRSAGALIAAFAFVCYPFFAFAAYRATPTYLAVTLNVAVLLGGARYLARPSYLRGLAVSLAIFTLLMTHVITTLLTAVTGGVLLLLIGPALAPGLAFRAFAIRIVALGIFVVLGLVLAAFEFLPIVVYGQEKLLRISALLGDLTKFLTSAGQHSTLHGLLSPRLADSAHAAPPSVGDFGFQLGLPYVLGFFLFLATAPAKTFSDRAFWGVAGLFAVLVLSTTPHLVPLLAPLFGVIQFPFRLLSVAALPGAIAIARAVGAVWSRGAPGPEAQAGDFDTPVKRALAVVVVGSIVGWSSVASLLEQPIQTAATGFTMPVSLTDILAQPSSTYSGDYLVNSMRFPSLFPSEPLLGRAQYFLFWHSFLAENGGHYDTPAFRPSGRERLKLDVNLLDEIAPPVHMKVSVGPTVVYDGTIEQRSVTIEAPIPQSGEWVRGITYEADKSTEKDGKRFFARVPSVVFEGLADKETVRYWNEFRLTETGRPTKRVFVVENPEGSANLFVLPALAYPMLQSVTINDAPSACRPAPRNDMVFCGVNLPAGTSRVVIRFTGMRIANVISLASLALLIAGGALAAIRNRRRPAPRVAGAQQ